MNAQSSFIPWLLSLLGKNTISQLLNDSGAWIQDHDGKAALFQEQNGSKSRHYNAF
jgi:hypothetical protein